MRSTHSTRIAAHTCPCHGAQPCGAPVRAFKQLRDAHVSQFGPPARAQQHVLQAGERVGSG